VDVGTYVAARGSELLARARRLTGDDAAAETLLVDALARLPRHLGRDPDDRVNRALLRRAAARPQGRGRVALVLRYVDAVPADEAADLVGISRRRLVAASESARSRLRGGGPPLEEDAIRRALTDGLPRQVPPDLIERVRRASADYHHRRRRTLAFLSVAVLVAAGIGVTADSLHRRSQRLPTAHAAGLLPWPARGDLTSDRQFLAAADHLWRRARPGLGRTYVLYAGRVGLGRLALLQARDGDRARAAIVADHDVSLNHPALRLDVDAPLPPQPPLLLVVAYDGNLGMPGLQPDSGSRLLQVLAAPGVDRIARRAVLSGFSPAPRPGFSMLALDHGLSKPWLDLSGEGPATALRVYRAGRPVADLLVPVDNRLDPTPVAVRVVAAPARWAPIGTPSTSGLADDGLWLAQIDHASSMDVAPVWSTVDRPLDTPARLVVFDRGRRAAFVVGAGAGSETTIVDATRDAVSIVHSDQACFCLIAVGSSIVASMDVGVPPVHVNGRVAVVQIDSTLGADVRAYDRARHVLRASELSAG
jgi:DNA-directed RNA polymerase specialized sigma24 family protein